MWLGQAVPPSFYQQVFGVQGPPQDGSGGRGRQRAGAGRGAVFLCARPPTWAAVLAVLPDQAALDMLALACLLMGCHALPSPLTHTHTAGLNPEPVRQGSELSARINAVMRQLRGIKELWQVRGAGFHLATHSSSWRGLGCSGRAAQPATCRRACWARISLPRHLHCSHFSCLPAMHASIAGVLGNPAGHPHGGTPHALPG